ncbi:MAG: leucine-rich repeat protein [Lachnospiraceae bacterium]|nr:leucine-rich repeat protein [Lachnospiraceae bacterium]
METSFAYTERNGGACITGLLKDNACAIVPKRLGDLPVTELFDRAFAGSMAEQIFLPQTLKKIGRYAFYGCDRLRELHFYADTLEIGGGVLNGCHRLKELFVHMNADGRSLLRDFVTEQNGRMMVHCLLSDKEREEYEAARLIFPAYYDEAVENTPARITVSNIHGSGQKYRYCFVDRRLQFDKYDGLFVYEKAEEEVCLAAEIALCRLRFPYALSKNARTQYETFLQERLQEVLSGCLSDGESFKWLLGRFGKDESGEAGLSSEAVKTLLAEASRRRLPELVGLLTNYRHEVLLPEKKKFRYGLTKG